MVGPVRAAQQWGTETGRRSGIGRRLAAAAVLACCVVAAAGTAAGAPPAAGEARQPCASRNPLRNPYFGDLHVHTALSLDASTQGTRALPADAYRFARGEPLALPPFAADGTPLCSVRLARPLDFAVVTDHAELFGELTICQTPELPGYDALPCVIYRHWPRLAFFMANSQVSNSLAPKRFSFCGDGGAACRSAAYTPWQVVRDAAEGAYDRTAACRFTTFVGYEWTGAPGSNNLHRNVIFRGDAVPDLPITYVEAPQPEELWRQLTDACRDRPDCEFLTIPHNSNLSGGRMFQTVTAAGTALTAADARARAAMEPLAEVMQHKGDSECRLGAETADELCGFEKLPYQNFQATYIPWLVEPAGPTNFLRNVLKEGLAQEERLGANPFKFGLVASTDTHVGAAGAVREDDFVGHGGAGVPALGRPAGLPDDVEVNPGGLAVLWAEENSRPALFAAMRRREAYGTSGPRMIVRFFGGWTYPADLCERADFVEQGYAGGVPMGGDLPAPPRVHRGPTFALTALRDPGGGEPTAPLQRLQIVKSWLEDGAARERVYDVSGDASLGATVDLDTCTPHGAGFDQLCTVWRDPDFVPTQRAVYYARALQNPTCRWTTYLCRAAHIDCRDPARVAEGFAPCCERRYPATIQERAWTSPIWYAPPAPGGAS
jgi:hypothetical protein